MVFRTKQSVERESDRDRARLDEAKAIQDALWERTRERSVWRGGFRRLHAVVTHTMERHPADLSARPSGEPRRCWRLQAWHWIDGSLHELDLLYDTRMEAERAALGVGS